MTIEEQSSDGDLGQQQQAIQDYDEAIRLKPDDAVSYNDRELFMALSANINGPFRTSPKPSA